MKIPCAPCGDQPLCHLDQRCDWGPDNLTWGATFGGTYVGHTPQTVPDPDHLSRLCHAQSFGFRAMGCVGGGFELNNLGDERYFTPGADTYANLSALPGIGRIFKSP